MDAAKILILLGGSALAWVYWDEIADSFSSITGGSSGGNGSSSGDGIFGSGTGNGTGVDDAGNVDNSTSTVPMPPWNYDALTNTAYHSEPSSEQGKEIKVRALAGEGSSQATFWQWNYYYELVTGKQGPDPLVALGTDVETVKNLKLNFNNWWGMLKQMGNNTGGLGNIPQIFGPALPVSANNKYNGGEAIIARMRPWR